MKNQRWVSSKQVFVRHNQNMWHLTHLLLEKDVKSQNGQEAEVGWHRRPVGLLSENKQRNISNHIFKPEESMKKRQWWNSVRCCVLIWRQEGNWSNPWQDWSYSSSQLCGKRRKRQTKHVTLRDVTSLLDSGQQSLTVLISLRSKWSSC